MSTRKDFGMKVLKYILFTVSLGLLLLGVYSTLFISEVKGTILITASIIFLIFSFLSRFKKFKGFGIEAELWEDKQIEAENLIKEIKDSNENLTDLIETISEASISAVFSAGRTKPLTKEYQERILNEIEAKLKKMNLTEDKINRIRSQELKLKCFDISINIYKRIKEIYQKHNAKLSDKYSNIAKPIDTNDPEFKEYVRIMEIYDDEFKNLRRISELENYKNYATDYKKLINSSEILTPDEKEEILSETREEMDMLINLIRE